MCRIYVTEVFLYNLEKTILVVFKNYYHYSHGFVLFKESLKFSLPSVEIVIALYSLRHLDIFARYLTTK